VDFRAVGCIDRLQFENPPIRIGEKTSAPNLLRASVVQTEASSRLGYDASVCQTERS
jgi:hypothetical protein